MNILITGAYGMLGTEAQKVLEKNHTIIPTSSIYLDVRNYDQVMSYSRKDINYIVHLAAETDHIASQFNPTDAYMTNVIGTQNMIELAKALDCPLLYMSTGGIFDGKKYFYKESDEPNPINHYGRSKYYGELLVKQYPAHVIVRGGWMMGGGVNNDKKFVNKIFKLIKSGCQTIQAISDVNGSPTYAPDIAEAIKTIIETNQQGIFHCVPADVATRFSVAEEIVKCLGLSEYIHVTPLSFEEYYKRNDLLCPYTKNECLMSTRMPYLRSWKVALKEYIEKEFKPCL